MNQVKKAYLLPEENRTSFSEDRPGVAMSGTISEVMKAWAGGPGWALVVVFDDEVRSCFGVEIIPTGNQERDATVAISRVLGAFDAVGLLYYHRLLRYHPHRGVYHPGGSDY